MRILAQGKSEKVILKVLRILINTSQSNFGDLNLDDACIRDIADVITAENGDGFVRNVNDEGEVQIKRPRGAILASSQGDFSDDHMPAQEAASTYADDESEQPAEESKE